MPSAFSLQPSAFNLRASALGLQPQALADFFEGQSRRILGIVAGRQTDDDLLCDRLKARPKMGRAFQSKDGYSTRIAANMGEGFEMDRLLTDTGQQHLDPTLLDDGRRPHG